MRYLSFDELYVSLVVSRRTTWDSFRARHHRLFRCLYVGYRVYRWFRGLQYYRLYSRFRGFTMIPRRGYVTNLALCEQFRHIPGAVVECGTWRGGMIAGIAALFNDERDYFLFDSFEGLPAAQDVDTSRDGVSATELQKTSYHNCRAEEDVARRAMELSGARNVHLRKGWFNETLSKYDGGPIAILRADGDWYESTMDILENLYPHLVRGGLLIFDDYYYWDGCARAVHDFLSKHQLKDKIYQCNDLYAYIVKQ